MFADSSVSPLLGAETLLAAVLGLALVAARAAAAAVRAGVAGLARAAAHVNLVWELMSL